MVIRQCHPDITKEVLLCHPWKTIKWIGCN